MYSNMWASTVQQSEKSFMYIASITVHHYIQDTE